MSILQWHFFKFAVIIVRSVAVVRSVAEYTLGKLSKSYTHSAIKLNVGYDVLSACQSVCLRSGGVGKVGSVPFRKISIHRGIVFAERNGTKEKR